VSFGDILKPVFAESGEFLGLQIRPELSKCLYMANDFSMMHLKRVIKICLYVNRMIRDGKEDDFHFK
jgi:hypothetical protein